MTSAIYCHFCDEYNLCLCSAHFPANVIITFLIIFYLIDVDRRARERVNLGSIATVVNAS